MEDGSYVCFKIISVTITKRVMELIFMYVHILPSMLTFISFPLCFSVNMSIVSVMIPCVIFCLYSDIADMNVVLSYPMEQPSLFYSLWV